MIVALKDDIILKIEPNGGKCFSKLTGNIVEVDKELYELLHKIEYLGMLEITDDTKDCMEQLLKLGVVEKMPNGVLNDTYYKALTEYNDSFIYPEFTVPDTIHYAITFKCNRHCKDCYMEKYSNCYHKEMKLEEIQKVFMELKKAGVLELAIGGGEPFQKDNLEEILKLAYDLGFVIHVTSGKYDLSDRELDMIQKYVTVFQIGLHISDNGELEEKEILRQLTNQLQNRNIIFGANFILDRVGIQNFTSILEQICTYHFSSTTLIRYKPPSSLKRWNEAVPFYEDWLDLESKLQFLSLQTNMSIRFDCALSFLARSDMRMALENGYHGCVAGKDMLAMTPDGSLFPCSQLVGRQFYIGNLKRESFIDLLKNSKVRKQYCNFRNLNSYKSSICGECRFSEFCGSCRALSQDGMNDGILCHDPVWKKENVLFECYQDISDVAGETSNGISYYTYEQYMNSYLRDYPERLRKHENR